MGYMIAIVTLFDDETFFAPVVAELFHPLLLPTEHLEASRLHALQHLGDACLDAHAPRGMRGVLVEHLEP